MQFSFVNKKLSLDSVALVAFSLACAVLLLTLFVIQYAHPVWQDEVQIIDYGRSILDQSTTWSISWDWINEVPVLNASNYLGCFIQSTIFGLSAFNVVAPRVFSLLGGIVCSSFLYCLLRALGAQRGLAVVVSCAYLFHPCFFNSFLADRVDSWSISMGVISCFIIARYCFDPSSKKKKAQIYSLIAGCAASFGFGFWISFPILTPFFLATIFSCKSIYSVYCLSSYLKRLILVICFFLAGFIFVQGALHFPILLSGGLDGYKSMAFLVLSDKPVHNSFADALNSFFVISFPNLLALAIFIASIVKSFFSDRRGVSLSFLFAFFVGAICIVLFSRVYPWRVVYLLPSLYVFIGTSFVFPLSAAYFGSALAVRFRFISAIALFILFFSFSMQKVAEFLPILDGSSGYAMSSLSEIARNRIPDQAKNVLMGAVEFYPVGRRNGWHMYPLPIGSDKARDLLASKQNQFDCIILDNQSEIARLAIDVLRDFSIFTVGSSVGDSRDGYSNYFIAVKK